jgi:hypothetical protein
METLSPAVAAALAEPRNGEVSENMQLTLNAVREISEGAARELAKHSGSVFLPAVDEISAEAAKELVGQPGTALVLDGLLDVSPEVAQAMTGCRRMRLKLGIKDLRPVVAPLEIDSVALARKVFCDGLVASSSVRRLRTMSADIAAEYVRCHPGYLKSLDTLSVEAAKELAKDTRDIDLPAITKLSPELATVLTERKPAVYLRGLKSLDGAEAVQVAEALASTPAPVYIEFLERVSAPALAALRKKATITLPPDEKLTIFP